MADQTVNAEDSSDESDQELPKTADLADIQGLVYFAWRKQRFAGFLLARFGADPAHSRGWLTKVQPQVTPAWPELPAEVGRLQIALSASGLAHLGLPRHTHDALSNEVKQGMAARHHVLHDEPHTWEFGTKHEPVDVLVMIYAHDEAARSTMLAEHRDLLVAAGASVRPDELAAALTTKENQREHFGFADGMSQPFLPSKLTGAPPEQPAPGQQPIATGEVLLGYHNAYGYIPQSPKWREPHGHEHDLGRNGTYLVFRKLEQDVATFWTWIAARARELLPDDPAAHAAMTERLGAKVMGRWKSGASLVQSPDRDDPKFATEKLVNAFGYLDHDPDGMRCPVSSHVRRANPRDARGEDSANVVKRHRIIRRGRSYGPRLRYDDAVAGRDDDQKRGLYFISLQSSVARGFEFIQQTWLDNPGFNSLFGEADPIIGGGGDYFTIPCKPLRLRLPNVPRVVTPVGGEYFFLPSLSALARIAKGPHASPSAAERGGGTAEPSSSPSGTAPWHLHPKPTER